MYSIIGLIAVIINWIFKILYWAIIVDCILSFVQLPSVYEVKEFLYKYLHPLYKPVRVVLYKTPLANTPFDFSPLITLLLLNIIREIIFVLLYIR